MSCRQLDSVCKSSLSSPVSPLSGNRMSLYLDDLILIGQGVFGSVYMTHQQQNGKFYVIKKEKQDGNLSGEYAFGNLLRTMDELTCKLFNDHMPKMFLNDMTNQTYMMMEYAGMSLSKFIRSGIKNDNMKRKIIGELINSLDFLHSHKIVHLDLKPDNIAISFNSNGSINVKILDIGSFIHNRPDINDSRKFNPDQNKTKGYVIGSPLYMGYTTILGVCKNFETLKTRDRWALYCTIYEIIHNGNKLIVDYTEINENVTLSGNLMSAVTAILHLFTKAKIDDSLIEKIFKVDSFITEDNYKFQNVFNNSTKDAKKTGGRKKMKGGSGNTIIYQTPDELYISSDGPLINSGTPKIIVDHYKEANIIRYDNGKPLEINHFNSYYACHMNPVINHHTKNNAESSKVNELDYNTKKAFIDSLNVDTSNHYVEKAFVESPQLNKATESSTVKTFIDEDDLETTILGGKMKKTKITEERYLKEKKKKKGNIVRKYNNNYYMYK